MPRASQPPSARDVERLRVLLERKLKATAAQEEAADALALAALEISESSGASRRMIAEALGVGTSTVQGWVKRGRQLRQLGQ